MGDWLTIGRVVGAHGLNGWLKVYPESDFPERFVRPGDRWLLRPQATEPEPIQLLAGRYLDAKKQYLIQLAGIENRNQAEDLLYCQLVVPVDDRLPLEPGEFHVADLVGLSVILRESQTQIGQVVDILSAGQDLLEVALDADALNTQNLDTQNRQTDLSPQKGGSKARSRRSKILIPFVEQIVPVVDLANQRIEIDPPSGLIEAQR
ncbi:ribosome maturation factor RimM [Romeria aff. gracilis LEGE 07310]|uniref:Ribosome maturation factor RimM n=1 Tax=Vasconcelosia minhoensis LEGE 07310 TaxID=915328 RepID=A0A8J7A621_9CYAN|nr:ribosome maturation factor RimM [Romeria gracilis]MBE9076570.1 ribosome maturation factor RimM [Romeria aff. gracilis LEGE 07310]